MIKTIVLISQGPNDIGFVRGLRDRLGSKADVVDCYDEPILRRRGTFTRRKDAKLAIDICLKKYPVDLFVRITDGDVHRPQDVVRAELARYPSNVNSMLVCGVCDRDVENWLALDAGYAAKTLHFSPTELPAERAERADFLKGRITRRLAPGQTYTEFVTALVSNAPEATFKCWLQNPAFRTFYDECTAAARRANCEVNKEAG